MGSFSQYLVWSMAGDQILDIAKIVNIGGVVIREISIICTVCLPVGHIW